MLRGSDELFLRAAVELARRGEFSTTPNPRVGCIVVRDGVVLGRGYHVRHGEGHAEVNAFADAADADVTGATVYVSLEPCAFEGKTPPCSQMLVKARVSRVVAAMTDPHPQVAGRGFSELRNAGIAVDVVELPEARALNAGYLSRLTRQRPFVRIKLAASLDARTAMASGESQWITGPAARADVQYWRARSCAILTGSGTVLADNPRLTVRDEAYAVDGNIRQPLRVVADSRLRVPDDAAVFASPGQCLLAHSTAVTPRLDGVDHVALGTDEVDLPGLLANLAERKCNEVLVEAGPRLVGALLAAGLWDELLVYQAPKFLGSEGRPLADLPLTRMAEAINATIHDFARYGDDVRIRLRPAGGQTSQT